MLLYTYIYIFAWKINKKRVIETNFKIYWKLGRQNLDNWNIYTKIEQTELHGPK